MEEEISLIELFEIIKKRAGMIVSLGLIGLIVSAIFTFFIATPQYSATTQILVNHTQSENVIQQSDINANLQLINTYKDIIKGPVILDDVRETLDMDVTHNQLAEMIEIGNQDNSQVFSIRVTTDNPFHSASIANTTAEIFQEEIDDIMNVDNVTIISAAVANPNAVSPNTTLNLAIGLLLGGMIGVGLAFVLEFFDNTVKDKKFITDELGWTYLGGVFEMDDEELEPSQAILVRDANDQEVVANTRRSRV
ncbi:YveK family protein [Atopococcus tabaci]|uniref:YveK family protein n=1 Tax=Atopococcus tabaci TaxID=269774 RepID=UPI0003FA7DE6|nr:Wzz/FepE/Etk N-terminal domain-containing protein [Atopococcus tabaci]